jgi:hypothetical protein
VDLAAGAGGAVTTCTMDTLRSDPASVVSGVNTTGRPALVTDAGRFVAMISPLSGVAVESILLQGLAGDPARADVASVPGDDVHP